jgi:hypothetical protein
VRKVQDLGDFCKTGILLLVDVIERFQLEDVVGVA